MFYVYKIRNIINNKIYVGKAANIEVRWQKHLSDTRTDRGYVLHRAIKKYGESNFEASIIEECDSEEKALEREIYWIKEYKTNICKFGDQFGYNLTDGGEGASGHLHSEESKQKMSEASIGKPKSDFHKDQLSIAKIGTKLSDEHKKNIGIGGLGKKRTSESIAKLSASKAGNKNPQSVLCDQKVKEIKILFIENNLSNKQISNKYGVSSRTIRDIKNNITWKHIKI